MTGQGSPRDYLVALLAFAARLRRGWLVGVIALAVGGVGTFALALSTHRLYRSEAVVTYELGAQNVGVAGDGISQRAMGARLGDMVNSRERLGKLIQKMNLYGAIVDKRGMVEAVDEMRRHLKIVATEGAGFRISYDGNSRDSAKDVLEKLLDDVIADDSQRRAREVDETRHFLESERQRADDDLKAKEAELSAFLTKHPQLAGEVGAAATGGLIRAADRDRAGAGGGDVAGLEMQAAQIQEALLAAGAHAVPGAITALDDPLLTAARVRAETELQVARSDLADKQARLTNEHPDVKLAMRRVTLAELAEKRADAALATARAARPPAVEAAAESEDSVRVAALKRALAAVKQQLAAAHGRPAAARTDSTSSSGAMVEVDTKWTRLNREVAEARERQTQLQSKQFQAELAATLTSAGEGAQLLITDRPFRPLRPVAGGRGKIVGAGAGGSLLLAFLAMCVVAVFDDRVYGAHDIERVVSDGFVVVIPIVRQKLLAPPEETQNDREKSGLADG